MVLSLHYKTLLELLKLADEVIIEGLILGNLRGVESDFSKQVILNIFCPNVD